MITTPSIIGSTHKKEKLATIQKTNRRLYRGYLIYQAFGAALDLKEPWKAERALRSWLSWVSRCRLEPFVKAGRTIKKYLAGIFRYLRADRPTNAIV